MKVSAYIPCLNDRATLAAALDSLRVQSHGVDEILVIDDGSTDGSSKQPLADADVRVIRHAENLGRGAARARGMAETRGAFVLCCDATCVLPPDFIARALPWFDDARVAAVFGRLSQPPPRNAAERWRGRHLFRIGAEPGIRRGVLLSTGGTIIRRSAVEAVGGYDPRLRHTEDGDLGQRLLAAGWDVVCDPALQVLSIGLNDLAQVLERYWRWNVGTAGSTGWRAYARQVAFSVRTMAALDLRAGDPQAAAISLLSPHYQFWRSRWSPTQRAAT